MKKLSLLLIALLFLASAGPVTVEAQELHGGQGGFSVVDGLVAIESIVPSDCALDNGSKQCAVSLTWDTAGRGGKCKDLCALLSSEFRGCTRGQSMIRCAPVTDTHGNDPLGGYTAQRANSQYRARPASEFLVFQRFREIAVKGQVELRGETGGVISGHADRQHISLDV